MKLHVLGIDMGKTVFHLVGLDSRRTREDWMADNRSG